MIRREVSCHVLAMIWSADMKKAPREKHGMPFLLIGSCSLSVENNDLWVVLENLKKKSF